MDSDEGSVIDQKGIRSSYPLILWSVFNILKFLYKLAILQDGTRYNHKINDIHSQIMSNANVHFLLKYLKSDETISQLKTSYYGSIAKKYAKDLDFTEVDDAKIENLMESLLTVSNKCALKPKDDEKKIQDGGGIIDKIEDTKNKINKIYKEFQKERREMKAEKERIEAKDDDDLEKIIYKFNTYSPYKLLLFKSIGLEYLPTKLIKLDCQVSFKKRVSIILQFILFFLIIIIALSYLFLFEKEKGGQTEPINIISGIVAFGVCFNIFAHTYNIWNCWYFRLTTLISKLFEEDGKKKEDNKSFKKELMEIQSIISLDQEKTLSVNKLGYFIYKIFDTKCWVDVIVFMFVLYYICDISFQRMETLEEDDVEEPLFKFYLKIILSPFLTTLIYLIILYFLKCICIYVICTIMKKIDNQLIIKWLDQFLNSPRSIFLIDNNHLYDFVTKKIKFRGVFSYIFKNIFLPLLIIFILIAALLGIFIIEKKDTFSSLSDEEKIEFKLRYIKFAKIVAMVVLLIFFFYAVLKSS